MGRQLTRPYNAGNAGAPSIAQAEILFSDTEQAVVDLPIGAQILRVFVQVITAFNAGTTNVLTVGITGTGDKYLAAADITEATPGVYPAAYKAPPVEVAAAETVKAFYAQTGTAATTGRAKVTVEYVRTAANG
jgi:hypothetical protein